jgi:hypothetical protein
MFEKKNHCVNCFEHAKVLLKHHQFASNFEQGNFISNETSKEKKHLKSSLLCSSYDFLKI